MMRKKINFLSFILALSILLDYIMAVFPHFSSLCNVAIVTLLLFIYILHSFNKGVKKFDLIIALFSLLLVIVSKDTSRISLFIFLIFLRLNNFGLTNQNVKTIFYTNVFCLITIMICYLFGFNKQYDTEIWRPFLNAFVPRMSFGFTHPNQFMLRVFTTMALAIILYNNKMTYIIEFAIVFLLYQLTNSRTVFYVMGLVLPLLFFYSLFFSSRKQCRKKLYYQCFSFIFPLFTLMSFVLSIYFSYTDLDKLLSGRLALNFNYIKEGIFLFGNTSLESMTFDNSYIHMLLTKGVIYFVFFSGILFRKFRRGKMNFTMFVLTFSLFGVAFMEVCMLKYNFMLLLGIIIFKSESENNKSIQITRCLNKV